MRIGIDARMFGSAFGIGRYIEHISLGIMELGKARHTFVLFVREAALAQQLLPKGVDAEIVVAPERWYSWSEQLTWPLRIARQKLDLIFIPQFNVPLLVPTPFVVTIHDVTQLYIPGTLQERSFIHRVATRATFAHAVTHARAVIAVSEYTKGEILKNFSARKDRVHVIYEGTGLPLGDTIRKNMPAHFVLAVSVWRKHKNFVGLLHAFAKLRRQKPEYKNVQLVLVGEEDPRYPEVRAAISQLKLSSWVVTPGAVNDAELDALYRGADLVVVPSFYEGFALTALEALARGIPVVASNAAALPEVLGDAAMYFNPHDTDEMAEVMIKMLTDDASRKAVLKAAPLILGRCSWNKAAKETLLLLEGATDAKNQ